MMRRWENRCGRSGGERIDRAPCADRADFEQMPSGYKASG
jgi:hypothetical protein